MAKALVVSPSFLPGRGGIESYLAQLCSRLAPDLAVLAPAVRDGTLLPADTGYPAIGYEGRMLWPGRGLATAVKAAAREAGTQKVLFGTPWPVALIGRHLERDGFGYAVIVHGAEMIAPSAAPLVRGALARSLAGADLLLAVSSYTASRLESFLRRQGLGVPPIEILRAQVDLDRFHPDAPTDSLRRRLGIAETDRVILSFGRLVRRKGVHRAIEVLDDVLREIPSVRLLIAGTGPQEAHLRKKAAGRPAVVFVGRVADEDASALYALADVYVLPVADRWRGLETEGLGITLLEAAACEVPCITGRSGGTPEAVIDGRTGYVVDATDPHELSDRIVRLLTDGRAVRKMGKAGRIHVAEEFSGRELPGGLKDWLG